MKCPLRAFCLWPLGSIRGGVYQAFGRFPADGLERPVLFDKKEPDVLEILVEVKFVDIYFFIAISSEDSHLLGGG